MNICIQQIKKLIATENKIDFGIFASDYQAGALEKSIELCDKISGLIEYYETLENSNKQQGEVK